MKRKSCLLLIGLLIAASLSSCSSSSSDVSDNSSVSSSVYDYTLPDYEKKDEMSSYISNDNYRNFYHIFVNSFADSNNDGIGDLKGITDKLDYLRKKDDPHGEGSLGIDGIFLSPVQSSISYHKYDIIDYESIDSDFGTMEDFDNFLSGAHDRGIKVIMDLVLNHCSLRNSLFIKALRALDGVTSCKSDGTPTDETIAATPEVGYFRFIKIGYSFTGYSNRLYNSNVGGWYFEGFSDSMPDWNLDNERVRTLQEGYMKFWLDKGVDGFRLDAVQSYYGEASINVIKNYEYLNHVNTYVKSVKSDAYIVAEGPWSLAGCNSYMKNTNIDSYFNFDTDEASVASSYSTMLNKMRNKSFTSGEPLKDYFNLSGYESSLNSNHIDAYFNSNHDVGRMTNQFYYQDEARTQQLKFFYAFQNTFEGNYFLYYGDEIGLMGVKKGDDDMYCRSPFIWGTNDSYTTDELEKGLSTSFYKYSKPLDEQISDKGSLFNFFRQVFKVKDVNPEISRSKGEVVFTGDDTKTVLNIKKTYNSSTIYLLVNYSSERTSVNLSEVCASGDIRNCISTDGDYASISGSEVTLPSMSITVIK